MNGKILLLLPLLLSAVMARAEATHLKVIPLEGAERAEAISEIGSIRYTADSMFIYSHSNALLHKAAFAEMRKLVFGEAPEMPTAVGNTSASYLRVYPNPARDALVLDNTQAADVKILTVQGQVVTNLQAKEGITVIPVSNLQNGTYFLLIGSEIVKFIKQ
jgi:hypothetical protein